MEKIAKSKEQKISDLVLWAIMGVSAIVLVVFFAWGYNTPYDENPDFIAPEGTFLLIWLQIGLIAACAVAMVVGAVHSLTVGGKKNSEMENIADKVSNPIAWGLCVVSLIIGAIYGITFQNEPMIINNEAWSDPTQSIYSDICIWSILILIAGTVCSTLFSMFNIKK